MLYSSLVVVLAMIFNNLVCHRRTVISRNLHYFHLQAQEVSFAMEASRRSRAAFAAANSKTGDDKCKEGILSVKRALDFNFQDVEGLLRLVRIAMDKIKPVKC